MKTGAGSTPKNAHTMKDFLLRLSNNIILRLHEGDGVLLQIRFLNVGDGDAILIEERTEGQAFRSLVDTGRTEMPACAE